MKKQGIIERVFELVSDNKGKYILGLLLSAVGITATGVPFLAVYIIIRDFLFSAAGQGRFSYQNALLWVIITVISIVVGLIGSTVGSYCCHTSAFAALYKLRMEILEHIGSLNLGFYTGSRLGELQKTMDENMNKLEEYISHTFPNLVGAGMLLLALGGFLVKTHILLAVIVLICIAIAFFIQYSVYGGESGRQIWTELNRAATDMDAQFSEYVMGMEEEKIFGNPDRAAKGVIETIRRNQKWWRSYNKRVNPFYNGYKTIVLSLLSIIIIAGTVFLKLDPDNLQLCLQVLTFMIIGPAIYNPLMELVEVGSDSRNVAVRLGQIDQLLNQEPMKQGGSAAVPEDYTIRLEGVDFSYQAAADPLRKMALKQVNLTMTEGQMTALVGPSGGGKSTLGQLIPRFWDVESGSITIGGIDIRELPQADLMNLIAFVFQDTHIFSTTVADNLAMNREIPRQEIEAAARAGQCHEFIMALPQGYDTRLGDGGHTLSGGEAQRIAIARAILKNAPIVILDEAMAYADAENELLVRRALSTLMKGKTVIMIAHRLYSIRGADQIAVIDQGQLQEVGSHQQLIDRDGLYAHLWNTQNNTGNWAMKGRGEQYDSSN